MILFLFAFYLLQRKMNEKNSCFHLYRNINLSLISIHVFAKIMSSLYQYRSYLLSHKHSWKHFYSAYCVQTIAEVLLELYLLFHEDKGSVQT